MRYSDGVSALPHIHCRYCAGRLEHRHTWKGWHLDINVRPELSHWYGWFWSRDGILSDTLYNGSLLFLYQVIADLVHICDVRLKILVLIHEFPCLHTDGMAILKEDLPSHHCMYRMTCARLWGLVIGLSWIHRISNCNPRTLHCQGSEDSMGAVYANIATYRSK